MAQLGYKKLTGDFKLITGDGSTVQYHVEGAQLEGKKLEDVPAYLALLAKKAMTGVEDHDLRAAEDKIAVLEAQVAKFKGELENAKKRSGVKKV